MSQAHAPTRRTGLYLAIAATVVVLATLVAAIAVMGTPGQQRLARMDERRVGDLSELADVVRHAARQDGKLPASLAALARAPGARLAIADPVTGKPYAYEARGPENFRLCAHFDTDTSAARPASQPWHGRHWDHPAGHHCFDFTVKEAD